MRGSFIWSFFFGLLLASFASCTGGGTSDPPPSTGSPSAAPPSAATPPNPPAPVGVIWNTQTALFRSETDGSGLVTLEDAPGFDPFEIRVSGSTVVYHVTAPPVSSLASFGLDDIWQVQTNGTGKRSVVATADAENILDVFAPWVIYQRTTYAQNSPVSSDIRGARLDSPVQTLVTDAQAFYRLHLADRAVFERNASAGQGDGIFSVLIDGTDLRTLANIPTGSPPNTFITPVDTVGDQVLFTQISHPQNIQNLFSVPVTGGAVIALTQASDYHFIGAIAGQRVIYQRCQLLPNPDPQQTSSIVGPCDVYSVLSDGTGTIPLATKPESEHVQGVIGSQAVIRRNNSAGDTLYSIPVGGGSETFILSVSSNEFVSGFVGDRMILRRSTGLWSVKADNTGLVQLTSDPSDSSNREAGPFTCFQRGPSGNTDLWCVPADGSGPATFVAKGAFFVSEL